MDEHFPDLLSRYCSDWDQATAQGAHHDQLRHLFFAFLQNAFPNLQAADIQIERHVRGLGVRGFMDALYRDVIFEFKTDLEAERREGLAELTKYIASQAEPRRFLGILTDGRAFELYVLEEQQLAKAKSFTVEKDRPEEAWLQLDTLLFCQRGIAPTSQDVIYRFGERSAVFAQARGSLRRMYRQVRGRGSVETKRREWERLLAHVYGSSPSQAEELFVRHTYLAILARLLAYAAIERERPGGKDLGGVVDGQTFRRIGIDNLVEEDFFTWVLEDTIGADAEELLQGLATHLAAYDFSRLGEDLLKELYQELVDPETRHDLGEFYTPDWLAELLLHEAGFKASGDLLDPACGSGTFLFTAIRLLRQQGLRGEALARWATERMAGLDVHPLAVTIARANFVLALAQEFPLAMRLTIPIYMADTLLEPEEGLQPTIPVAVQASEGPMPRDLPHRFDVPLELATEPRKLDEAIALLAEFARLPGPGEAAVEGFHRRLADMGLGAFTDLFDQNLRLLRHLVQHGRDTVHVFILRNACRPELLARRKFALVAGNPPWLSYRFIERPDYQRRVKDLVFRYGLLDRQDVHLFTHMELATLFFAFCHDRFVRPGGTLAFVMPRSVLTGAQQHVRFQAKFHLRQVLDLEQVEPLFNVPACVLVAPKNGAPTEPEVWRYVGGLPAKNLPWAEAQRHLRREREALPALAESRESPYLGRVYEGATIGPRCLWFVRTPEGSLALNPQRPQVETDPAVEPQAKPPWKGLRLEGEVEAPFLYVTMLGDDLVPFGWRNLRLVVLPAEERPDGRFQLLDVEQAVRRGWIGLADWLRQAESLWDAHKSATTGFGLAERLDYQKTLTRQRPGAARVLYATSGTYLAATVLEGRGVTHPGGLGVRGFAADQVTHYCEVQQLDEAHYLAGFLNAPIVDEGIKALQARGSFGPRHITRRPFQALPIPKYTHEDHRHQRLVRLSQLCHEKVGQMELPQGRPIGRLRQEVRQALSLELGEIDQLVREILGSPPRGGMGSPPERMEPAMLLHPSAEPMVAGPTRRVLDGLLPLLADTARATGVTVQQTEVGAFADPEEDSRELVVTQWVRLPLQQSLDYWDQLGGAVERWVAQLPSDLAAVAAKVAIEVRPEASEPGL